MYGVIFDFLRSYVIERHGGRATWDALLKEAGVTAYNALFEAARLRASSKDACTA